MPWSFFFPPARSWTGLRRVLALLALALVCGLNTASDARAASTDGQKWCTANLQSCGNGPSGAAAAWLAGLNAGSRCSGGCTLSAGSDWGDGGVYFKALLPPPDGSTYQDVVVYQQAGVCVAGYTLQPDGTCKSNTPPPPNCSDPSLMNKYRGAGWTTSSTANGAPDYICIKGCQYDPGSLTVTYPNSSSVTGYTSGGRAGSSSGKSCDLANWPQITIDVDMSNATDVSKLPPSPEHCAAQGRFFGQVNGVDVCSPAVPGGSTTSTSNSSSSTNDSPASSPAASSTNDTTTRTTCTDTTCTTTTVVAVGGGGGVAGGASSPGASTCQSGQGASAVAGTCTTTTTTSRDDYCKANPKAPQCEQDSASGGADCGSPPACSGDAISCAILQQQWNTRCELQKGGDAASTLGQQIQAGNDPMASQLPTPGKSDASPVSMADKFSSVDNMGIAEQCLQPIGFSVFGFSYSFDTGPLCKLGQVIGMLNVMGTLMLCAYMLKGSF